MRELWDVVHYGGVGYDGDRRALEALCTIVSPEQGVALANKVSAKLAWEAIATRRIGGVRVLRCNACAGSGKVSPFSPGSKSRTLH